MKKLTFLLALTAAVAASSCKSIDPIEELNSYDNCLVYAVDTVSGSGCLSNFASIDVVGDMTTSNFTLNLNDFQLHDGDNLRSGTLSNLPQFMADVRNETDPEKIDYIKYYFFKYQSSTRQSGDLDISDFRFGWLSSIYWLNFTAGSVKGWSVPQRYVLYAVRNEVRPQGMLQQVEQAIFPKYTFSIDVQNSKLSVSAYGVKYPLDATGEIKSLDFRNMEWNNLPLECTESGYKFTVSEFSPVIDGNNSTWKIKNMTGRISADYDGEKRVEFTLVKADGTQTVRIYTDFSYVIPQR